MVKKLHKETRVADFWIEDDMLFFVYKDDISQETEEDTVTNTLVSERIVKENDKGKMLVLVDLRNLKLISHSNRNKYSKLNKELSKAVAIVANNPVTTMIANVFMKLNSPPNPTRMFINKNEAISWLKEQNK